MRIRLRVGIFGMFMAIMLPLTGAMTGILYQQNVKLAEDMANDAMDKATTGVMGGIQGMLDPIVRTVELSTAFGATQRDALRHPDAWKPLMAALRQQPDLYSLYYGFAHGGEFLQMIRLPPGLAKFGPKGTRPPDDGRYVIRTIDDLSGQWGDSFIYTGEAGDPVRVERVLDVKYDPRQRPWYKAAQDKDEVVNSGIYVFSSSGRPGLTLSQRIRTDDNQTIGVFGADLAMDHLSELLATQKVGRSGLVFIVDADGRLIGYPDGSNVINDNGALSIPKAKDFKEPVVAAAMRHQEEKAEDRFRLVLEEANYMVSISPLPGRFSGGWKVGVVANEKDFVDPIRRASIRILVVGVSIVLLSGLGVMLASRLLTRPIAEIITETNLIRDLDLEQGVHIDTRVNELMQVSDALDSMKSALRSFAVYVPKELVRSILESRAGSALGGVRQPTTILFSDLEGFTKASEILTPEDVLSRLSDYFDVMADAIHRHQGTIDKYIGDAIMALWNAPTPDPQHQLNACRAMLACRDAGLRLNEDFARRGLPPMRTRLGLHTGSVVVGNVGSAQRMQYTALGSAVNLASRIEGLNKKFGTELLITGSVEEAVRGHFLLRPLGQVVASGTTLPMPLFELLAERDCDDPATRDCLARWMAAYEPYLDGDWAAAARGFEAFLGQWDQDAAAALFLAQCRQFIDHPPPAGAGVTLRFDSK
jgi:adenylate cyclase